MPQPQSDLAIASSRAGLAGRAGLGGGLPLGAEAVHPTAPDHLNQAEGEGNFSNKMECVFLIRFLFPY